MLSFLLVFLLFLSLSPARVFAQNQNIKVIPNYNRQRVGGEYAKNRIIVEFKPGRLKQDLQEKVYQRVQQASNSFGFVAQKITDLGSRVTGQSSPEQQLDRIENLEKRFDVVAKSLQKEAGEVAVLENPQDKNINVQQAVEAFSQIPEVEFAEPDYKVYAALAPNDEYYSYQWPVSKMQLESAWNLTTGDTGNTSWIISALNQMINSYSGKKIVVNLSLGGPTYSQSLETSVNNAWNLDF